MKLAINIVGGLAGALVLNAIHEGARRIIPSAPEINKVGEEAITKVSKAAGMTPPAGKKLYTTTLAGDLVSNAIYYSAIGKGNQQTLLLRGVGYGLIAGLGVIGLTKPLGLDDEPVNKRLSTKVLTVLWYTLGGIVAASAIKILDKTAD